MTPIKWRKAESDDAERLAQLGAATFLASFAYDHPGADLVKHLKNEHSPAYYRKALNDPETEIIIGETPLGAPVAYAMLTPPSYPGLQKDGDIELKRIYLLGPWQGNGNGTSLFLHALDRARNLGAKRIILAVYENNERAIAFYKGQGFDQIGDVRFNVGNSIFNDLLFARNLDG